MTWSSRIVAGSALVVALSATLHVQEARPAAPIPPATRAAFLDMFARGYYPGRTGQLMIVPREGHIITRADANLPFMHGSPWPYDVEIPLLFVGAGVRPGVYPAPATQQDVAPTLAAALGTHMPPTASGRPLPVRVDGAAPPRAVVLIVLDGMRPDYFDRHAAAMPTLSRLRREGAWMANARINYLPTNTGVGHSTLSTGADPRVHGITGNNRYDLAARRGREAFRGWQPEELMALTLADVWQLERRGRPVIIALGASTQASTALAGHGACQPAGFPVTLAGYDERAGRWGTNPTCYAPIDSLREMSATALWPADGRWMGHQVDTASGVRRSGLFPRFEADALVRLIETLPIGEDEVPDLILANYKAADYVGHKHGPGSPELGATLEAMDTHLARILAAVEARVGDDYLLALTADHGMPGTPAEPAHRHQAPDLVDRIHARFDPQRRQLIPYYEPENAQIFVDLDHLAALGVTLSDLAAFLESEPAIAAAFTEDEVRRAAGRLQ